MRWLSRLFHKIEQKNPTKSSALDQEQIPSTWEPWTLDRFQEVKTLLENKTEHEITTDDRLLATEFIVQQIADETIFPTQDYYEKWRSAMRDKLQREPPPPKWEPDVSMDDITVPAEIRKRIYALYRKLGVLTGGFDNDVDSQVNSSFSHNYLALEAARQNGYIEAKGLSAHDEWCPIAKEKIANKSYRIEDLLSAYETGDLNFPILPHPQCPHYRVDGGSWCRCIWMATKKPIPPGVDPKFAEWMEKELESP